MMTWTWNFGAHPWTTRRGLTLTLQKVSSSESGKFTVATLRCVVEHDARDGDGMV